MNYSLIRQDARERLRGNWSTAVISVLLASLFLSLPESLGLVDGFFGILGSILFIIVSGPISYGLTLVFSKINRKQKSDVGYLFDGFKENMSNKVSAGVSIYVYTFLWSLLLIIPGIIASYSYSMTYYIMIDNPNMSSSEAITKSKQLMNGNKMKLFCLDLTFIGWMLLSILTFGIGMLWVSAYMEAAHARFYEELVGAPAPVEAESEEGNVDSSETIVKTEDEVAPYSESEEANVIYRVKCETCGATDTDTKRTSTCPYCGGKMKEV